MSSPITSVPEPSSSGGVDSIITQVSPNAPLPGRNTGPARPQKVKASKKKKEKKVDASSAATTQSTEPATQPTTTKSDEVGSLEENGKGKVATETDQKQLDQVAEVAKEHAKIQAEAQATGNSLQVSTGAAGGAGGGGAAVGSDGVTSGPSSQETVTLNDNQKSATNNGDQINHATEPSSTVVGDTTQSDTVSSKGQEEPNSTPIPLTNNTTDSSAVKAASPASTNQSPSDSKPVTTGTAKTSSKPSSPAAKQQKQQKQQKQTPSSPFKKLIALLTCSGGASAIVASEKKSDGKDSRNKVVSGGDGKSKVSNGNPTSSNQVNQKARAVTSNGTEPSSSSNPTSTPSKSKKKKAVLAGGGAGLGAASATGLVASHSTSNSSLCPPKSSNTPRRSLEGAISGSSTPKRGSMILGDDDGHSNVNTTPGGGTRIPREETGDVMSAAVVPPGSSFVTEDDQKDHSGTGLGVKGLDEDEDEDDEDESEDEDEELDEEEDEERRLIMQGGIGIPFDENGNPMPLLSELGPQDTGRKCLVLDLDETLVHSSFKAIQNADFIVPVEIEGTTHSVFVIKRPGVDEFMRKMGEIYEVVVFTASLSKYADPVLDILDIHRVVRHRLFRESCYNHKGNYVKDLSQLGRPISESIIIDNSPASYIFHPNNAVPVSSWFNDPHDTELTDLCPFLADLAGTEDVRAVLDGGL